MIKEIIFAFTWVIIGMIMAVLFFISQRWTVRNINPTYLKLSKLMVIGGAILRWATLSLVLIFAMNHSITAALLVFASFIILRIFILFSLSTLRMKKQKNPDLT